MYTRCTLKNLEILAISRYNLSARVNKFNNVIRFLISTSHYPPFGNYKANFIEYSCTHDGMRSGSTEHWLLIRNITSYYVVCWIELSLLGNDSELFHLTARTYRSPYRCRFYYRFNASPRIRFVTIARFSLPLLRIDVREKTFYTRDKIILRNVKAINFTDGQTFAVNLLAHRPSFVIPVECSEVLQSADQRVTLKFSESRLPNLCG